ncbi:MAG: lipoprotein insertase outer membrane protein LolB [Acinetobacter sp.]|nr:lipoprotein insertase outer membrane protein LolB [Acinetobacter sp.]
MLFKQLQRSLILSTAILFTACQTVQLPQQSKTATQTLEQFQLQGKIGVRTPQQSGSAFYTWIQQNDEFDIELSGILGIGKTSITGKTGDVTLKNAQVGELKATSPEQLLQQATGWSAPISHLKYWVMAKPATAHAQMQQDTLQRATHINEDGWQVELEYNEQTRLPNRLTLIQAINTQQQNRIIMTIQDR